MARKALKLQQYSFHVVRESFGNEKLPQVHKVRKREAKQNEGL